MRLLAERLLDDEDRLGVADVGELRRVDQVADGVDAVLAGAAELVDDDEAPLVDLDASAVEPEPVGVRPAADRDDHGVDLEVLPLAEVDGGAAGVVGRVPVHHDTGADVDLLLLEAAHDDVGDVVVETWEDLGECLEDRHLGPEVGERRRELAADRPATDDGNPGRHVVEVEDLVTGHDRATPLEVGDQAGHRSGREHDVGAGDLGGRPVRPGNGHDVVGAEATDPVEDLDLAGLAHRRDAADEPGDDLLLAGLGHGEVHARRTGLDAEVGGVLDVAVHGGGLEERLGGDAAPVEARAAEGVHLDQCHLGAGRSGVEGAGVAARTSSDEDEIELLGRRDHPLSVSVANAADTVAPRSTAPLPPSGRESSPTVHPGGHRLTCRDDSRPDQEPPSSQRACSSPRR